MSALLEHNLVSRGRAADRWSGLDGAHASGCWRRSASLGANSSNGQRRNRGRGAPARAAISSRSPKRTEQRLKGREQFAWLTRLDAEHDNLRVALGWAVTHRESDVGLRLGGALHWYWFLRSHWSESLRWLDQILALPAATPRTTERAKALMGAGTLAFP